MNQQRLTDAVRLQDAIIVGTGATVNTVWIDLGDRNALLATIFVALFGTTVDAKFQQATDNAGTGAKDITQEGTTAEITQIAADDVVARMEVYNSALDLVNDFRFVSLQITTVGAANVAGLLESVQQERYNPDDQSAKVVQTVIDRLREGFEVIT